MEHVIYIGEPTCLKTQFPYYWGRRGEYTLLGSNESNDMVNMATNILHHLVLWVGCLQG